jgi:hypothetical protein
VPGDEATAGTLAVIERSHRGTAEQQYAHVLWLASALSTQTSMTVLLRGTAAVYALATEPPVPPIAGSVPLGISPDYRAAISRLLGRGCEIYVSSSALRQIGADKLPVLSGVRRIPDREIAGLVARHSQWWFL